MQKSKDFNDRTNFTTLSPSAHDLGQELGGFFFRKFMAGQKLRFAPPFPFCDGNHHQKKTGAMKTLIFLGGDFWGPLLGWCWFKKNN